MASGCERSNRRVILQELPDDILAAILGRLGAAHLSQARMTCKRLAAAGRRPHLPPRQEQLQLALAALGSSGSKLVISGWTRASRPTTGRGRKKLLLRQPEPELTETLRHLATLDISSCGQVFDLVVARLRGSTALRALRLRDFRMTEERAAALQAAGILGGVERLDVWNPLGHRGSLTDPDTWRVLGLPGLQGLRSLAFEGSVFLHGSPPRVAATLAKLERLETLSLTLGGWEPDELEWELPVGGMLSSRSQLAALLGALLKLTSLTSLELDLRRLELRERDAGEPQHRAALSALCASLPNLTHLGLAGQRLHLDQVLSFPAGTLTSLGLRESGVHSNGAWRLAKSALGQLKALCLAGYGFPIFQDSQSGTCAAEAGSITSLTASNCRVTNVLPLPEGLTSLHLEGRQPMSLALAVRTALLPGIGSLRRLATLHLAAVRVGGTQDLGHLSAGTRLTSLHLDCCQMADADFAVLAESRGFSSLKSLSVVAEGSGNEGANTPLPPWVRGPPCPVEAFSATAVKHLAKAPWLCGLENLTLSSSGVGHEGAAELAAAGGLSKLTCLDLSYCCLGDKGARALAESQSLRQLARLRVRATGITRVGSDHLARSTSLVGLKEVYLH